MADLAAERARSRWIAPRPARRRQARTNPRLPAPSMSFESQRPPQTLAFHAASPRGARGYVLLLERVEGDGWVAVRRWESPDYTAPAVELRMRVSDLRATLARQARAGWRFTLALERIHDWLEGTSDVEWSPTRSAATPVQR